MWSRPMKYLDRRTGKYWPAVVVDAAVSPVNIDGKIVKASNWLKQHALVTSLARDPDIDRGLAGGLRLYRRSISTRPRSHLFQSI